MKKIAAKKAPTKKVLPAKKTTATEKTPTAKQFIAELLLLQSDAELKKILRFFKSTDDKPLNDTFIGVRMGHIFNLAKAYTDMPPSEIEKLMENKIHEIRVGAMSMMAKQYMHKKTTDSRKKELYDLYLRRHDRINNWDLVDLAAHYVVGPYLADKPRMVLYKLARSKNPWERRTAILSTAHYIMKLKQTEDTFRIAELLLKEKEDLVQKATGWMLRTSFGVDRAGLQAFLEKHAAVMPRPMLRAAIEKFDPKKRAYYLGMAK